MAFRKPSDMFALLLFLLCSIFFPQSVAEPYVVSEHSYEKAKCYHCMTVLDERNNVYSPLSSERSKPCAASNRTKLDMYKEVCPNPYWICTIALTVFGIGSDGAVLSSASNGLQFKLERGWRQWSMGDSKNAVHNENCLPRFASEKNTAQTMMCYCETHYCNDWTLQSLKQRFYNQEKGLMPPIYNKVEYADPDTYKLEFKQSSKEIEPEACFRCTTQLRRLPGDDGFTDLTDPPCAMETRDDLLGFRDPLYLDSCRSDYRCGVELRRRNNNLIYQLTRGCISKEVIKSRYNGDGNYFYKKPWVLGFNWLYFERGCSMKVKSNGEETQNCVCDFHYCNEWSLTSLLEHSDDVIRVPEPTNRSLPATTPALPPTTTTTVLTTTPTTTTSTTTARVTKPPTKPPTEPPTEPSTEEDTTTESTSTEPPSTSFAAPTGVSTVKANQTVVQGFDIINKKNSTAAGDLRHLATTATYTMAYAMLVLFGLAYVF